MISKPYLILIYISGKQTESYIARIDVRKSCGPDNLHAVVLKSCRWELSKPLSIIFNQSLSEGHLPQDWRNAVIVPIFKSGDEKVCGNYRPIK